MPDIVQAIAFDEVTAAAIRAVCSQSGFRYQDWGCEQLEGVRAAIRSFYRVAQLGRCVYCRNPVSFDTASNCHVEHIVPKSRHPEFIFEPRNLCVICADCNTIKRNQETSSNAIETIRDPSGRIQYPRSPGAFLIVHPHFDDYAAHIHVLMGRYYLDKSDKGAFTIRACELNRHLRTFGWDVALLNDAALEAAMQAFLDGRGTVERAMALVRLKDLIATL